MFKSEKGAFLFSVFTTFLFSIFPTFSLSAYRKTGLYINIETGVTAIIKIFCLKISYF